jgi:hypothetical protein
VTYNWQIAPLKEVGRYLFFLINFCLFSFYVFFVRFSAREKGVQKHQKSVLGKFMSNKKKARGKKLPPCRFPLKLMKCSYRLFGSFCFLLLSAFLHGELLKNTTDKKKKIDPGNPKNLKNGRRAVGASLFFLIICPLPANQLTANSRGAPKKNKIESDVYLADG